MATSTLGERLSAEGGDRPRRSRLGALSRVVVICASVVPIAVYLWVAAHQLGYRYELEWMEGGSVEMVGRVLHGQPIYTAPTLHYVAYSYTPLYFWVSALVAHVTGLGFLPLRLVSFLSSLGCFALLFTMVRRETGDAVAGLLAAGMFAATFEVGGAWLDIGRVDSLFLFLLLAAVAAARRATTWQGGALVGLLVFASFFTKQTALLAAAPMLVFLVVTRRRVGLAAAATAGLAVVVSTVILDTATAGWYRYYIDTELTGQPLDSVQWTKFFTHDLLAPVGWAIALAGVGLIVGWSRKATRTAWPFWLAATAGMVGASWVSRLYAAVAIGAALGYAGLRRAGAGRPALVGVVLAAVVVVQVAWLSDHPSHLLPTAADAAAGRQFIARVATTPGDVIVLDHPWYETMAGKPSWAQGEAVHEVLRSSSTVARRDLLASIASSLDDPSVRVVYLDNKGEIDMLAPALAAQFQPGGRVFSCYQCFFPRTDVAFRPYLEFVRR
jgi:hypothetical protein